MPYDPAYAGAISSIESGGRYGILGPVTNSGDRAYGKYQIMGTNVPVWTKEFLGQAMTPQEFLANPQAQDAVFQAKFGQYVDKYGPEGAAQAWIGGPGGVGKLDRKDILGTSIGDYGQKFMAALGQPQAAPQVPMAGGAPAPMAAAVGQASMPAFSFSPGAQEALPQAQYQPQADTPMPAPQAPDPFRFDPSLLDPDRPNALMKKIALSASPFRRGFAFRT